MRVVISGRNLGERLRLPHRPVLSHGFQLEVGAGQGWTPWTLIEDLSLADPDDRVYVLDTSAGEVGFGDGEHGARPPTDGATIRASYRRGSGSAGNVTGIGGIISQLKRKLGDIGRAIIRLRVEEGTEPLLGAYHSLRSKWFEYLSYAEEAQRTHDHRKEAEALQSIEAGAKSILDMAKADLDQLGKPI